MSALADPGENFGPEVNPNPIQVTGNAGDAYNLGYGHGYVDGLVKGRDVAREAIIAKLAADGMSVGDAIERVRVTWTEPVAARGHTRWSDIKAARIAADEKDAAESERRAAEAMEDDSEQS